MVDMKRKAIIFLSLSLLTAIFAVGIVINEWKKIKDSWGETVKVAVAKQDIQPYSIITKDSIEWKELPKQFTSDNFIFKLGDIENNITIVDIKKGDFLTPNVIRAKTNLSPDERVVWLNISSNVFLDQAVAPGDRVDIIVTYQADKNVKTERLFQSVPVVQREDFDKDKMAIKVSLPLKEAERLIYYQNTAQQIRVLLSNQIETATKKGDNEFNVENGKNTNTNGNNNLPTQNTDNQNGKDGSPLSIVEPKTEQQTNGRITP